MIDVTLAVEDSLSEAVGRKLITSANPRLVVDRVMGMRGFGYLKSKIEALNQAAHNGIVSVVIADLDDGKCPEKLRRDWLRGDPHRNLLFRVAVKEIESWLLADHQGLAQFFGIPEGRIPQHADEIPNPKQVVVNLARSSKKSDLRGAIVPRQGSSSAVGPEYNNVMLAYVDKEWNLLRARPRSGSLERAYLALQRFEPVH
jgi:hypothetical protein